MDVRERPTEAGAFFGTPFFLCFRRGKRKHQTFAGFFKAGICEAFKFYFPETF
jgi:hypothetical protein